MSVLRSRGKGLLNEHASSRSRALLSIRPISFDVPRTHQCPVNDPPFLSPSSRRLSESPHLLEAVKIVLTTIENLTAPFSLNGLLCGGDDSALEIATCPARMIHLRNQPFLPLELPHQGYLPPQTLQRAMPSLHNPRAHLNPPSTRSIAKSPDHVTPPSAFVHCRGCPCALQSPQSRVPPQLSRIVWRNPSTTFLEGDRFLSET